MPKRVTVVVKEKHRQGEALRYSLGLMFERHEVCLVVLDHELDSTEECAENAAFIDEMGGTRLSNVEANIARHGFDRITTRELTNRMVASDLVIPF